MKFLKKLINMLPVNGWFWFGMFIWAYFYFTPFVVDLNYINTINRANTVINQNISEIKLNNTLIASIKDQNLNIHKMLTLTDQTARMEQYNMLKNNQAKYDEAWGKLSKVDPTDQEQTIRAQIVICRQNVQRLIDRLLGANTTSNQLIMAQAISAQIDQEVHKWVGLLEQCIQLNNTPIENAKITYGKVIHVSTWLVLIQEAILFTCIWFIFITVHAQLTGPLKRTLSGLTETTRQVMGASNQLAALAQQLSQGSSEQAAAIEETSSTLQESASMLMQNTGNTKQATQLSVQARESAEKGNIEMQEMMNSIQEIKQSSDQIAKIIKVIDDIAFQTNILALNAAVEAARAGEAGMGFAVVAEEVRNLAQRSAQAAKDTTVIIESNIALSGKGVAVAERVREALNEITVQAKKVNELMGEIAMASQEQTQGIYQVNKAVSQMEKVTEQNAASAEESVATAEELRSQSDNIKKMFVEILLLVNGSKATLPDDMTTSDVSQHRS